MAGPRPARPLSFELFTTPAACPWVLPAMSLTFPMCKRRQKCGLCWHMTGMKPGKEGPGQATANPHPRCVQGCVQGCMAMSWAGCASQAPKRSHFDPKFPSQ